MQNSYKVESCKYVKSIRLGWKLLKMMLAFKQFFLTKLSNLLVDIANVTNYENAQFRHGSMSEITMFNCCITCENMKLYEVQSNRWSRCCEKKPICSLKWAINWVTMIYISIILSICRVELMHNVWKKEIRWLFWS